MAAYPTPCDALSAVLTDSTFACHTLSTARTFAAQVPTCVYEFDDPYSPTLYGAQVPGVDMANARLPGPCDALGDSRRWSWADGGSKGVGTKEPCGARESPVKMVM